MRLFGFFKQAAPAAVSLPETAAPATTDTPLTPSDPLVAYLLVQVKNAREEAGLRLAITSTDAPFLSGPGHLALYTGLHDQILAFNGQIRVAYPESDVTFELGTFRNSGKVSSVSVQWTAPDIGTDSVALVTFFKDRVEITNPDNDAQQNFPYQEYGDAMRFLFGDLLTGVVKRHNAPKLEGNGTQAPQGPIVSAP